MKKLLLIIMIFPVIIQAQQLYVITPTIDSAQSIINRINKDCIKDNVWTDNITNNYCDVIMDANNIQGAVIYDIKYDKYFTEKEKENLLILPNEFIKKQENEF